MNLIGNTSKQRPLVVKRRTQIRNDGRFLFGVTSQEPGKEHKVTSRGCVRRELTHLFVRFSETLRSRAGRPPAHTDMTCAVTRARAAAGMITRGLRVQGRALSGDPRCSSPRGGAELERTDSSRLTEEASLYVHVSPLCSFTHTHTYTWTSALISMRWTN